MIDVDLSRYCKPVAGVFIKPLPRSHNAVSWIGKTRLDSAGQNEHFLPCRLAVVVEILFEVPVVFVEELFSFASIDKQAIAANSIEGVWHFTTA